MPIDSRKEAKQRAKRSQRKIDRLEGKENRGLRQEINLRKANAKNKSANNYLAGKEQRSKNPMRDVNQFAEGQTTENTSIDQYDFGKKYNMKDVKYLKSQGYTDDQIAKDMAARDTRIGGNQGKYLKRTGNLGMVARKGQDEGLRAIAKRRAQSRKDKRATEDAAGGGNAGGNTSGNSGANSGNNRDNNTNSGNTSGNSGANSGNNRDNVNDSYNTEDSYNQSGNSGSGSGNQIEGNGNAVGVGNTAIDQFEQNVGNKGDTNIGISGSTFGAGASIGNDYGVNIVSNSFGGGPGQATGLANMQGAAAYSALNNNAQAKSNSQLNGYSRAAGASEEAEKATGARDRVANLYNLAGQYTNYYGNKSTVQQGYYMGDLFDGLYQAPGFKMPPNPDKPEDKTEEIANSADF